MHLQQRIARMSAIAACGGVLVASPTNALPAAAAPPVRVVVDGRTFTADDMGQFLEGFYASRGSRSFQLADVSKAPRDMPSDAPLVSYRGRVPGHPAKEVVWNSNAPNASTDARYADARLAAFGLILMDSGYAGSRLRALYARTPHDRPSRQRLGTSFARAFRAISERNAAVAASQAAWIRAHVVPGITRAAAYRMLRSQGLTAYNDAFVKDKTVPPELPGNAVKGWCDVRDRSSGAWPYMNEAVPKRDPACAVGDPPKPGRNPEADVDLSGAFDLTCGWRTRISIRFDRGDRVAAVKADEPLASCL